MATLVYYAMHHNQNDGEHGEKGDNKGGNKERADGGGWSSAVNPISPSHSLLASS